MMQDATSDTASRQGRASSGSSPLEDYALIGDTHSAGLVCRNGSLDWLCLPRFDSPACFAALLGDVRNGRWQIRPAGRIRRIVRRYRGETLILETEFQTTEGTVRLVDCMLPRQRHPRVVRQVVGVSGAVAMHVSLRMRFEYGSVVPWVRHDGDTLSAVAGPDALEIRSDVPLQASDLEHVADFTVRAGERVGFTLTWHPSYRPAPPAIDVPETVARVESWWDEWAGRSTYAGPWREPVRSTIREAAVSSATSRRPSRIWPSSPAPPRWQAQGPTRCRALPEPDAGVSSQGWRAIPSGIHRLSASCSAEGVP